MRSLHDRRAALLLLFSTISLASLFGCSRVTSPTVEPVRVGSVLFLTGPAASYGEMQKTGFEIALEEINASGGINGCPIEVIYEDSADNEQQAVAAVKKLIAHDKVPIIVEVTGSGESVAAAPIAGENKTVILSAIDSTEKLSGISPYFFRIMPSDAYQGRFLAEWAWKLGWKRAAMLYVNNEWGVGMRESVSKNFQNKGGNIVQVEGSSEKDIDLRTQLTKIKAARADGVFLLLYPQAAGRCLKQAKQLDLAGPFLGGDALSGEEVVATGGPAVEGLMFCQPSQGEGPAFDAFRIKYQKKYGRAPSVYSIKSYDALKIAADAIRTNGYSAEGIRRYLASLRGYPGISGVITLDKNGDIADAKFEKFVYRKGTYELLR
jgi:branched-chain amino acid transport system substrate-binding protein